MPSPSRHELNQLLLVDFTSFVQRVVQTVSPGATYEHNWHIEAMCYQLMRCYRGEIKRLIITVPPRHLKSICASVAFPAWVLARNPKLGSVVVTYSNELGDHQSRLFRAVVNADWYRAICPALEVEKDTATEFVTTKRGFRYATSVCGTLTGRGAHFMLIDDPMKSEDAFSKSGRDTVINWYRSTLASRLDKKKDGCIILVMQRHHSHDLVGHLLESDPNGWVHLDLPAIAQEAADIPISDVGFYHRDPGDLLFPQREGVKELEQLRRDMDSAIFSAQYLQRPLPEEGLWIKRDWFQTYDHPPVRQPGDRIIQSYDTATKANERNDPSVCTTWLERKGAYFLLHVARAWLTFPELKQMYLDLRAQFQPDVILVEDGSGTSLIQEVWQLGSPRPIPIKPKGTKQERMYTQIGRIEAGQVYLPREAPWRDAFLFEVLAFPGGRHDDQVDSLAQFLTWVGQRQGPEFSYEFIDIGPVGRPGLIVDDAEPLLGVPEPFSWL